MSEVRKAPRAALAGAPRRVVAAAIALTLAFAAVALASSFKAGSYAAGNPGKGAGVKMRIKRRSFAVKVIRYRETCEYGSRSFSDYFAFESGSAASLTGRVRSDGRFHGKYGSNAPDASAGGQVSVRGRVRGTKAIVKSSEAGPYDPGSTVSPNRCSGSQRFRARLKRR